ncbi:DUF2325 domain-containing protein [Paludibacterium paludis]|uniref:DUF2325 domain-containing protein n=1 Tax=Paludibacterium paludis TaxID=1225769 RepID=A0A918UA89_9NEIS|nr:DUF2325 domain-containing protein [Paludibacterium paludis]GGY17672.1 hypothetical protein GCM10011289_21470 [Paludibacterium paludis]
MKKALIVGGDNVDLVRRELAAQGYEDVQHWPGRKPGECRRPFPRHIDLVVVMLGHVNHTLCQRVRHEAGRQRLPILFSGRKHTAPLKTQLAGASP